MGRARAYSRCKARSGNSLLTFTMAAQSITTEHYKLFPSPRNRHRTIFLHQVFVPHKSLFTV